MNRMNVGPFLGVAGLAVARMGSAIARMPRILTSTKAEPAQPPAEPSRQVRRAMERQQDKIMRSEAKKHARRMGKAMLRQRQRERAEAEFMRNAKRRVS